MLHDRRTRAGRVGGQPVRSSVPERLSSRQAEVANLVVSGRSSREIAVMLSLSPRTVETHITAVFDKLGVSSRVELIRARLAPSGRDLEQPVPLATARTNLPVQRWDLVGRESAIAELIALLDAGRLVTLTGTGGVGKTRTALAVGASIFDATPGDVWFVELASMAPGASAAETLADVLHVRRSTESSVLDALIVNLKRRTALILLDNCEHVVSDVAELAAALLAACPHLRILATSREPLRIAAEQTYRLPSLRVPLQAELATLDAERGSAFAAIALYAQRARATDLRFELTDENIGSVAQICRSLDGIPLAIELAAARVNVLPPAGLAAKLDAQLRLLTRGDRAVLARHQTMRALIDWSYDLLTVAEQTLFDRLAIFAGGCTLTEAAAVCAGEPGDELGVLDGLSSLVDKSLVVADLTRGEPRYGMLQTFAEYAREKLAARSETMLLAQRHAAAYFALAQRLDADYDAAPPGAIWHARVRDELENWRAALAWTLGTHGDIEFGQRLTVATRQIWLLTLDRRWVQLAHDLVDERTPFRLAADLEYLTAAVARRYTSLPSCLRSSERAIAAYTACSDVLGVSRARGMAGYALALMGRLDEAERNIELATEANEVQAEPAWWARDILLEARTHICFHRGDQAGMRRYLNEQLAFYQKAGSEWKAVKVHINLAEYEFVAGNAAAAFASLTASLQTVRSSGVSAELMNTLNNLAAYCIALERWKEARTYASEALVLARTEHHDIEFAFALQHLAATLALPAIEPDRRSSGLALAAGLVGYIDVLLDQVHAVRQDSERSEDERIRAILREHLPASELDALLAQGARMTEDRAIDVALSGDAAPIAMEADRFRNPNGRNSLCSG